MQVYNTQIVGFFHISSAPHGQPDTEDESLSSYPMSTRSSTMGGVARMGSIGSVSEGFKRPRAASLDNVRKKRKILQNISADSSRIPTHGTPLQQYRKIVEPNISPIAPSSSHRGPRTPSETHSYDPNERTDWYDTDFSFEAPLSEGRNLSQLETPANRTLSDIGLERPELIHQTMALWGAPLEYRKAAEPAAQAAEDEARLALQERAVRELPRDINPADPDIDENERYRRKYIVDNAIDDVIAENPAQLPHFEGDDDEEQAAMRSFVQLQRDREQSRNRYLEKSGERQGIPAGTPARDVDLILPRLLLEQMPHEDYANLSNVVDNLEPITLREITRIAENEMVRTYVDVGLEPPVLAPEIEVIIIDDDDTHSWADESSIVDPRSLNPNFALEFMASDKKYANKINALKNALVKLGLLVAGGLDQGYAKPLKFNIVKVLKYLTSTNSRLRAPDDQFNAQSADAIAVDIIMEHARMLPRLYQHFGGGIKKILRKEYDIKGEMPDELRPHTGRRKKVFDTPPTLSARLMANTPIPARPAIAKPKPLGGAKRKITFAPQAPQEWHRGRPASPLSKQATDKYHIRGGFYPDDFNVDLDATPPPRRPEQPSTSRPSRTKDRAASPRSRKVIDLIVAEEARRAKRGAKR